MTLYRVDIDGYTVSDCLEFQFNGGRQFLLDTVAAASGTARFRLTNNNSTILTAVVPDAVFQVFYYTGATYQLLAAGYVEDVTLEWGNPTTGSVYNDDHATIVWSGLLSVWGRQNMQYTVAANTLTDQLADINSQATLPYTTNFATYNDPDLREYQISGSANDYLQFVCTTTNCRIDDTQGTLNIKSPYNYPTSSYNFTDAAASSSLLTYQSSDWDSLSVNYYNQVLLNLGSAPIPVVATDTSATEPYRVLQLSTLWQDSGAALGYAEFLLDMFKAPAIELSSVTCLAEAQVDGYRLGAVATSAIGKKFSVVHRGTTYYGICEGWSVQAAPGSSRFTFYFSSAAQDVAWFILDSSTQGVLDVNKLGF